MIDLKDKTVLVLGLGETGLSMLRYLSAQGAHLRAADSRTAPAGVSEAAKFVQAQQIFCGPFTASLFEGIDLIAISPGVALAETEVTRAINRGVPVVGDIELLAMHLQRQQRRPKVLAITGANGKTTVTSMVAHMCGYAGKDAVAAGNISPAVLDVMMRRGANQPEVWVLELSSFQLETTATLQPDAATVLNVTEDHLDRYAGMDAYAAAKARVLIGCKVQLLHECVGMRIHLTDRMLTPQRKSNMGSDTKTTTFNFPYDTPTKIAGEPTNATITILKRQIYANAMENACTLGCGTLGYLGIIMPDAEYNAKQTAISKVALKPFTKPIIDVTADDDTIKEEQRKLRDYIAMESLLKKQLLSAIDPTYLTALEDAELGMGFTTGKEILVYITAEYGTITLDDLAVNMEKLNEPWNSEQPIRLLWDRIKECQRIGTAGGEPITDRMAMYTVLKLLDATGVYHVYTTSWRQTHPIQTAWQMATFKEFFNHADKDRKKNLTTKDAGFHGANAATYADKVKQKTEVNNDNNGTTNNARTTTNFVDPDSGKKIYYCWSHGGTTNPNHTSAKCKYPKEGHQKEATWMDMMDGCCEMKFGKNKKTSKTEKATD